MDSIRVSKQIKTVVRPLLRGAGFSQFTSRSAWRYSPEKTDVVNFQSFNSYLASTVGCTTYSFGLRIGSSFGWIPQSERVKRTNTYLRPEEYECHFRLTLQKSISQALKRTDIWYIDPSGENLESVIADAARAIEEVGLAWFDRFRDPNEVLGTLLREQENGTFGFGAMESPIRNFMTGFTALHVGKVDLARDGITKALKSGCFGEFESQMRHAIKQTNLTSSDSL